MTGGGRLVVLGAGAWGTALANIAARGDREVTLWCRDPGVAAALVQARENPRLPGVRLAGGVTPAATMEAAGSAAVILVAVPAQAVRQVAGALAPLLRRDAAVIACAKGIERGTGMFMTQVIADCLPTAVPAVLSGPSFAADVARGLPTAVTLAAHDDAVASGFARMLGTPAFRLYHSNDVRGVEIGGAAKNVLAIAAGIVHGRGLGPSAAAALTTRGFAELSRFGRKHGARPETLTGLSGLGDLVLTCSSPQSRNFSLGVRLGRGLAPAEARRDGELAEGWFTASVLAKVAVEIDVDMPISTAVAAVLDGRLEIGAAIDSLLARPFRAEY